MSIYKRAEIKKTAIRSLALQGCNTFDRQQGLGFGYAMIPFLKHLYQDDEKELSEALLRQTALFNITPQMVNFVLGITMAMEEEGANNPEFDKSSINAMKTALMGPLSGLGDAIFWGSLRTIAIGVGIAFSAGGSILGPLSFFLIYNIPALFVRYYGMILGYEKGVEALDAVTEGGLLDNITMAAKILGSTVVGFLIATVIKFSTSITLHLGESVISIQEDVFDLIMPNLLPFLLSFGVYYLAKKGKKTSVVMAILIGLSFVIAFIEYIPALRP